MEFLGRLLELITPLLLLGLLMGADPPEPQNGAASLDPSQQRPVEIVAESDRPPVELGDFHFQPADLENPS